MVSVGRSVEEVHVLSAVSPPNNALFMSHYPEIALSDIQFFALIKGPGHNR